MEEVVEWAGDVGGDVLGRGWGDVRGGGLFLRPPLPFQVVLRRVTYW